MTTIRPGVPATLTAQWRAYPGGPAVDVTGLEIKILRIVDLSVALAQTSVGIEHLATGLYAYQWTPASDASGGYAAIWPADDVGPISEILTVGSAASLGMQEVIDYIGVENLTRWEVVIDEVVTYPQVADALAAETRAQLRRCRYPASTQAAPDPDLSDLHQALKRRVQRNLAMRPLPLAMQVNTEAGIIARPGGKDPEIRRLEAPYPKSGMG